MKLSYSITLAATFAFTGAAHAAILTAYDLTGAAGNETSWAATQADPGVTALALTRGSGINASSAANGFAANGWNDLSPNDFFSFGFTVPTGSTADLTDLIIGTRSSNTGPGSVALRYSVDGFATNIYTLDQSGGGYVNSDLDLSSLTGLTGTVEFRLYAVNTTSANGGTISATGTFRVTDFYDSGSATYTPVTLNGTVAGVPEPASLGLLAVGGLALLRRRR